MKQCKRCLETKDESEFYTDKNRKSGLVAQCKLCYSLRNESSYKQRRVDPEYAAKECARVQQWRIENSEKYRQGYTNYYKRNAKAIYTRLKFIKCARNNRNPEWLSDEDKWIITEIYRLADQRTEVLGYKWEVDHIIPLKGKQVSGLHVPANLQVVPAEYNRSKGNKFQID